MYLQRTQKMSTTLEKLRTIFENVDKYNEARHARPVENPDPNAEEEPEESFTDYITRKINTLQKTTEELQQAIDREREAIKNGNIGLMNGNEKISGWQSRLNATQFKVQMLQKALEAYTNDQSEDNERNLRITAMKTL